MKGKAPNSPFIGFHWRPVKKPKPNWRIDNIESDASATIIAITIETTNSPTANISKRKIASPVLPVGESTRRQSECFPPNAVLSGLVALIVLESNSPRLEIQLTKRCASSRNRIDLRLSTLNDVSRKGSVL